MKAWKLENQPEFDFDDCYILNYPPLELSKYIGDRNYEFYKLQNELLIEYNKTKKIITLTGNVRVDSSNGDKVRTDDLVIRL